MYYYITWDALYPKGCKIYGFKSSNLPSILVKQSSGVSCNRFSPKWTNYFVWIIIFFSSNIKRIAKSIRVMPLTICFILLLYTNL